MIAFIGCLILMGALGAYLEAKPPKIESALILLTVATMGSAGVVSWLSVPAFKASHEPLLMLILTGLGTVVASVAVAFLGAWLFQQYKKAHS